MSGGYLLSERAQVDLLEIWWYVFQFEQSDDRADAAVDRIYESIQAVAEHPKLGSERAWAPDQLVFPTGDYLIIYCLDHDGVVISRVYGADEELRKAPR